MFDLSLAEDLHERHDGPFSGLVDPQGEELDLAMLRTIRAAYRHFPNEAGRAPVRQFPRGGAVIPT